MSWRHFQPPPTGERGGKGLEESGRSVINLVPLGCMRARGNRAAAVYYDFATVPQFKRHTTITIEKRFKPLKASFSVGRALSRNTPVPVAGFS